MVASVAVAPQSASLSAIGDSLVFTAVARDSAGSQVSGVSFAWTSSDATVVTVSSQGVARAVANGSATVQASAGGFSDTASVTVTAGPGPGPGPGPGTVLFQEQFEDGNFAARGWYDDGGITITTAEAHAGTSALEFHFTPGALTPVGIGARHLFTETESVYLSYWVKYSANWVGSGDPFQPHEFLFMTDESSQFMGPAFTKLTVYVEHNYQNGGIPVLGAQDGENIDVTQINQDLSGVTENRAANGCNGNTDGYPSTCFPVGTAYYNGKWWLAPQPTFTGSPGPGYKNDWHFVEAYFQLNSIQGGIGQTDGVVRYWFDGQLVIDHQDVLLRTGAHPSMKFNQFLMIPFIGSGSPVDQTMWVDELTVATSR